MACVATTPINWHQRRLSRATLSANSLFQRFLRPGQSRFSRRCLWTFLLLSLRSAWSYIDEFCEGLGYVSLGQIADRLTLLLLFLLLNNRCFLRNDKLRIFFVRCLSFDEKWLRLRWCQSLIWFTTFNHDLSSLPFDLSISRSVWSMVRRHCRWPISVALILSTSKL